MEKSAVIHARIEPRTKQKAENVLRRLGLSPTEAIRLFYRQICLRSGLPFPVALPNALTRQTLTKSQQGKGVTRFDSLDEMFTSWEK
jgi:DNA-damage-inducible protein J